MKEAWVYAVEQIVLSAEEQKFRVLGFTSPQVRSGVGELSGMVAEALTRAGLRTLLIDLCDKPREQGDGSYSWSPQGQGIREAITRDEDGADRLQVCCPTAASRYLFNNVQALRQVFADNLASYHRIVLVLPEVGRPVNTGINPLGPAAACDAVYLVCVPNAIGRDSLANAIGSLRAAGAPINGLILNEADQMTPGEQIARSAEKTFRRAPRFGAWIACRARASRLLN